MDPWDEEDKGRDDLGDFVNMQALGCGVGRRWCHERVPAGGQARVSTDIRYDQGLPGQVFWAGSGRIYRVGITIHAFSALSLLLTSVYTPSFLDTVFTLRALIACKH